MMNEAIEKLRAQQAKVKERSPQWMVAEQLIDILRIIWRRTVSFRWRICSGRGKGQRWKTS